MHLSVFPRMPRVLAITLVVAWMGGSSPARADHENVLPVLIGGPMAVGGLVSSIGSSVALATQGRSAGWGWTSAVFGACELIGGAIFLALPPFPDGIPGRYVGSSLLVLGAANIALGTLLLRADPAAQKGASFVPRPLLLADGRGGLAAGAGWAGTF